MYLLEDIFSLWSAVVASHLSRNPVRYTSNTRLAKDACLPHTRGSHRLAKEPSHLLPRSPFLTSHTQRTVSDRLVTHQSSQCLELVPYHPHNANISRLPTDEEKRTTRTIEANSTQSTRLVSAQYFALELHPIGASAGTYVRHMEHHQSPEGKFETTSTLFSGSHRSVMEAHSRTIVSVGSTLP